MPCIVLCHLFGIELRACVQQGAMPIFRTPQGVRCNFLNCECQAVGIVSLKVDGVVAPDFVEALDIISHDRTAGHGSLQWRESERSGPGSGSVAGRASQPPGW